MTNLDGIGGASIPTLTMITGLITGLIIVTGKNRNDANIIHRSRSKFFRGGPTSPAGGVSCGKMEGF